ncbi:MAG: biliverdin-producing heme oxygenase [Dokdonella sp.]|uniref:biliverdin-producing heme oxygenase n=1 Tax=Dokdonella sp. TaxID=2291710 RepID=UPI0032665650
MDTGRPEPPGPLSLSAQLRARTRDLHTQAERSGIMRALLRGDVQRAAYVLLLRNLHAIYAALEAALEAHAAHPLIAPLYDPLLWRRRPLEQDLDALHGAEWRDLAITPTTRDYVIVVTAANPATLVAHAYVRYLGDLSGGQILARIVQASLQLEGTAGSEFYRFATPDAGALAQRFRRQLDGIPVNAALAAIIVGEARRSFSMHVRLFEELAVAPPS